MLRLWCLRPTIYGSRYHLAVSSQVDGVQRKMKHFCNGQIILGCRDFFVESKSILALGMYPLKK